VINVGSLVAVSASGAIDGANGVAHATEENLSFASRFPSRASPLHPSSFGRRRSARRNALPPPRSIRTEARQATFARHSPTEEDGERVVLATDRPIGFLESANQPRSINYPFTIIEMQLNRAGEGEGRMSLATKVMRTLIS
jgi:hypothetical protein